ncbi:MAG: NAD(+)/NADH kinase [Candidatus Sabulitectum sp.]|nr:NAD(+)/NADH kinase [Candidatus Sabulitectum sp.]
MKAVKKVYIPSPAAEEYGNLFTDSGIGVLTHPDGADAAIAIGGDGTILKVMDALLGTNLPILGVNAGHLGFLADSELDRVEDSITCLISGDYGIDDLPVLKTTGPGGVCVRALNEICISRAAEGGILHIRILVDGREIAVVASDGVLVSTPSGSTAYNLSCGGPILHPNLPVVIITAICPHLLAIRPIVVPLSSLIEFTILRSRGKNPLILADGMAKCGSMAEGDTIAVQPSSLTCPVIRTGRRSDYYAMLGKKLGWGYRG